jgi:ribosomal protein S18 acetylase RimI-like enzyme
MVITARPAAPGDAGLIADLYRGLAEEMDVLRPLWSSAEGLADPLAATLGGMLAGPPWHGYIGMLDEIPVGFLLARDEELLPQAGGRRVAAIRFIYTLPGARQVGVGEAMMDAFLADAADRGLELFDAHVSPGHRESKNFFESNGFSARSIVMHRGNG